MPRHLADCEKNILSPSRAGLTSFPTGKLQQFSSMVRSEHLPEYENVLTLVPIIDILWRPNAWCALFEFLPYMLDRSGALPDTGGMAEVHWNHVLFDRDGAVFLRSMTWILFRVGTLSGLRSCKDCKKVQNYEPVPKMASVIVDMV